MYNKIMDFTPQQKLFLSYYCDPKSETWGNALQSGLKAGYSDEYSAQITAKDLQWLKDGVLEIVSKDKLLKKARKNLEIGLDGLLDKVADSKKIQADLTKFTLKTIDKDNFSERQEITGKDGEALKIDIETKNKIDNSIKEYINDRRNN